MSTSDLTHLAPHGPNQVNQQEGLGLSAKVMDYLYYPLPLSLSHQMWLPLCGWGPPLTPQGCPGWSVRPSPNTESCPPLVSASQALPPASQRPHTSPPSLTPTSVRTNRAQRMRSKQNLFTCHLLVNLMMVNRRYCHFAVIIIELIR